MSTQTKTVNKQMLKHIPGFTLVEMAIVMLIIGLILGGLLIPLGTQVENERRKSTRSTLAQAQDALIGFAVINKRLPCPDTSGNGLENGPTCNNVEGELPWITLGISRYDAWGRPFRYRADNAYTTTIPDPPDTSSALQIQERSGTVITAANPSAPVAIIFSCGSNGKPDVENDADGTPNSNTLCSNAGTANATYVQDISVKDQFDDILVWVSRNTLLNQMISAGKWP